MTGPATSETPPPFDPTLPPSASLLLYFHAERVLPATRSGTRLPLSGVRVDTNRLACALLAVAIWHLREAGLVRLEPVQERHRLTSRTSLHVMRVPAAPERRHDGIEGGILDLLTPSSLGRLTPAWESLPDWLKGWAGRSERSAAELARLPNPPVPPREAPRPAPETVFEVVTRWYGRHVRRPSGVPIAWTEREGVAKGYLAEVDAGRNPLVAFFLGKTARVAQRDRIDAVEGQITELLARWQDFKTAEREVFAQLEHEVAAAIDARVDTSDTG
jgi:hypothetical protein